MPREPLRYMPWNAFPRLPSIAGHVLYGSVQNTPKLEMSARGPSPAEDRRSNSGTAERTGTIAGCFGRYQRTEPRAYRRTGTWGMQCHDSNPENPCGRIQGEDCGFDAGCLVPHLRHAI
jgi:hypothetical protein